MKVLMTPDGKRVVTSNNDQCLYSAPQNPPNTGTDFTRGTDLYYHKARSGNEYYYFVHWSMWQGESGSYELIDFDVAEAFLLKKAGLTGWAGINKSDLKELKKFGFNILEEDA